MNNKRLLMLAVLTAAMLASVMQMPAPALAQTADPVLVAAGDIVRCGDNNDEKTAALLDAIPGTIATLGDNAYPDGTLAQFNDCYSVSWGRHKARIRPAVGNHEYHVAGAAGYFTYFGQAASPLENNCTGNCKGYYSYNLGSWHIIVLNTEIDYKAGSAQDAWLRADLAANPAACTLAYWHEPLYSSGMHGNANRIRPIWTLLYQYGVDVVLNGHDHTYERFAPMDPNGQADPKGIREFVVGTGGSALYDQIAIQPNSEARNDHTFGVLKMTLRQGSYAWEFVPVAGGTYQDSGTANCVTSGSGGSTPVPTATSVVNTPVPTSTLSVNTPAPTATLGVNTPVPTSTSSVNTPVPTSTSSVNTPVPTSTSSVNTPVPTSTPKPPTATTTPKTPPPTASATIIPGELIFKDSFDGSGLGLWTYKVTDNGDLRVRSAVNSRTSLGTKQLNVRIDDTNPIFVLDGSPNAEWIYRARFYFDPNSITMKNGDAFANFMGYKTGAGAVFRLEFGRGTSGYSLRLWTLTDASTWSLSPWIPLTDDMHALEILWRASTAPGANNGVFTLWVDGVPRVQILSIDNDTRRIDEVRLGAPANIMAGTRGTVLMDAFESRRQSYIGLLP